MFSLLRRIVYTADITEAPRVKGTREVFNVSQAAEGMMTLRTVVGGLLKNLIEHTTRIWVRTKTYRKQLGTVFTIDCHVSGREGGGQKESLSISRVSGRTR
jgi:hypothetical protein